MQSSAATGGRIVLKFQVGDPGLRLWRLRHNTACLSSHPAPIIRSPPGMLAYLFAEPITLPDGKKLSTLRDAIGYLGGGLISRSFSIRAMGETQPRPRELSAPILEYLVSNPPKRT